jgi:DNA helicase IV
MTAGEKRFAQRLESKLEDDYYCWYEVPLGGKKNLHPDFIILNPRRGVVVLEVKDWKPDNIQSINRNHVMLLTADGPVQKTNPMEQARHYAEQVSNILSRDPQLVSKTNGRLVFPWTYGVVLTNITRKVFDQGGLADVIPEHRVICQDEMLESVDPLAFQEQLWQMFTIGNFNMLSLPQVERIRWHLFPEIRLPYRQASLFEASKDDAEPAEIPDLIKVMDLQQEQLARSLGEGHRVIHGVAGSGKTMILGYRAQYLAETCSRPILILCYNKILARRLRAWMESTGVKEKVCVATFHSWCWDQLRTFNIGLPTAERNTNEYFDEMVQMVIQAADKKQIPTGQYDAVLIDEGHDFRPEWFKLVVQMVNPQSSSLLVLYDDAQSIYDTHKKSKFSFKNVGIQATGRTKILKINYRNTQEVLDCATTFAQEILAQRESDEDGVPTIAPVSAGRIGPKPIRIKLPTLLDEAQFIAKALQDAHKEGIAWKEMAILYRHWHPTGKAIESALKRSRVPYAWKDGVTFNDSTEKVSILPFQSSKGLEFELVAIPGIEIENNADLDEAKLLYVAMTRSTSRLIITSTEMAA